MEARMITQIGTVRRAPSQLTRGVRGWTSKDVSLPGTCAGTTTSLLLRCPLQIRERSAQPAGVIGVETQCAVATAAKQPTHAPRGVAVIDAERTRHLAADRAGMALPLLQRAIVCEREPVAARAFCIPVVWLERPPHAPPV